MFWALELVRDRDSKAPFDASMKIYARLKRAALEAGLLCYPSGGTADGVSGDHVLLAPPFIVEEPQLDEMVEKLSVALELTLPAS